MIRKLIYLNLKDTKVTSFLAVIVISIILTLVKIQSVNLPIYSGSSMIDIEILLFGGLDLNFNISNNIIDFVLWLLPILLVITLVSITNEEIKNRAPLTLPKIKLKSKWIHALNISLFILVLEYYVVLFLTSLITILVLKGPEAFYDIGRYGILLFLFIMNLLMVVSIILFVNNISLLFMGSKKIEVTVTLLFIISVLISKISNSLNKILLINQGIIVRHSLFSKGIPDFSVSFSLIYLSAFIFANVISGILIVRRVDLSSI